MENGSGAYNRAILGTINRSEDCTVIGCIILNGTTKATTEIQEKENLIKRDFSADKPLKKVVSDITKI